MCDGRHDPLTCPASLPWCLSPFGSMQMNMENWKPNVENKVPSEETSWSLKICLGLLGGRQVNFILLSHWHFSFGGYSSQHHHNLFREPLRAVDLVMVSVVCQESMFLSMFQSGHWNHWPFSTWHQPWWNSMSYPGQHRKSSPAISKYLLNEFMTFMLTLITDTKGWFIILWIIYAVCYIFNLY